MDIPFKNIDETIEGHSVTILTCTNASGESWLNFRKKLKPNYSRIYFDLFICYSLLVLGFYALLQSKYIETNVLQVLFLVVVSLWIGYWLHAILCFYHEALHFNIAANRQLNDALANALMGIFFGIRVERYRSIHWKHHQKLGEVDDPENSYHRSLTGLSMFADASGLYLIRRLFFRKANSGDKAIFTGVTHLVFLLFALLIQSGIVVILFIFTSPLACIAWVFAFLGFFPLLNRIRQTLEHRSFVALKEVDYSKVGHGVSLRIFGKDFFSRTFGSAGFNQHLFHHLDPRLSYTNFDQMSDFFEQTSMKSWVDGRRSGYLKTFLELFTWR